MADEDKIKNLDNIFEKAISLSNAHIEKKIMIPYEPIIPDDKTPPHNPVRKNLDFDLYGCPKEIMQASSGIYALTESDASFHVTPEAVPNCMSFLISTCGNSTHPILSLKHILDKINPSSGKICYYKEGYDIAPRKSGFPKTIEGLIRKYYEQFDISKYRFNAEEVKQFQYDFYFYEPSRFTQKMASILGIEWPLSEEDKRLGMWLEGKEFALKNGNGHSEKEKG